MKKVFALGVASLVMLGTASQASAAFEEGNFIMSVYDTAANLEMGIDLGAISQTELQTANLHKVLASGLAFTGLGFSNTQTSGVGVFAMDLTNNPASTYMYSGYFATTNSTGTPSLAQGYGNGSANVSAMKNVGSAYKASDQNQDGIASFAATFPGSYVSYMNTTQAGGYAGIQTQVAVEAEYPVVAGSYVDMYLYQYMTNATYNGHNEINYGGPVNGQAVIRLTNDGQVILNPGTAPVPVPGAAWLLGAGLLGLAGIRRRKNS